MMFYNLLSLFLFLPAVCCGRYHTAHLLRRKTVLAQLLLHTLLERTGSVNDPQLCPSQSDATNNSRAAVALLQLPSQSCFKGLTMLMVAMANKLKTPLDDVNSRR